MELLVVLTRPGPVAASAFTLLMPLLYDELHLEFTSFCQVNLRADCIFPVPKSVPHKFKTNGLIKIGFKDRQQFMDGLGSVSGQIISLNGSIGIVKKHPALTGEVQIVHNMPGIPAPWNESALHSCMSLIVHPKNSSRGVRFISDSILKLLYPEANAPMWTPWRINKGVCYVDPCGFLSIPTDV